MSLKLIVLVLSPYFYSYISVFIVAKGIKQMLCPLNCVKCSFMFCPFPNSSFADVKRCSDGLIWDCGGS